MLISSTAVRKIAILCKQIRRPSIRSVLSEYFIQQFLYPRFVYDFFSLLRIGDEAQGRESHAPPVVAASASQIYNYRVVIALGKLVAVIVPYGEVFVVYPYGRLILEAVFCERSEERRVGKECYS